MSKSTMRAPLEGGCSRKRGGGVGIGIGVPSPAFLLVVVVLFMLLVTVAVDGHDTGSGNGWSSNPRSHSRRLLSSTSLPRKVNRFRAPVTHAKLPRSRGRGDEHREREPLYEDNKRIIHTGPNPLHN
ncbi:hypothetical protein MLD38_005439 [Melastoma candidum]|uniref:Uncharacterized protein n=1 Tax=Melastoma candidum TaxID=119954 RepID=A0ACB9RT37_9MYRT|nr:hypothetical protein MLD38_005439 [Melastoma candidum]